MATTSDFWNPSDRKQFITESATIPRDPTSIVRRLQYQPFSLIWFCSGLYFISFRKRASNTFSSAGQVSSMRITFFTSSDHKTTSGLWSVTHICTGNGMGWRVKSIWSFQSVAPSSRFGLDLFIFCLHLDGAMFPRDETNWINEFPSRTGEELCTFKRAMRWGFMVFKTESCLQEYLLCFKAAGQSDKMWKSEHWE